jgi:chromosome segregation ATPase
MFVKKSEHDTVVAERDQLKQQNEKLQAELDTAKTDLTAINKEKETLAQENATLKSEAETSAATITSLTTERDNLASQVKTLTEDNAKLKDLPGAESTAIKSKTEINHGEQKSTLEQVNDFCRENSGDVNSCLSELKKVF